MIVGEAIAGVGGLDDGFAPGFFEGGGELGDGGFVEGGGCSEAV